MWAIREWQEGVNKGSVDFLHFANSSKWGVFFFQALNVFLTNANVYNFIVFIIIAVAITCLLLIAHFSVGFAISVGFKSALMVL